MAMRKKEKKRCYNKMGIQRKIRILSLFANIGVAEARLNEIDRVEVVVANGHISTIACCRHEWKCRHTDEWIGIIIGAKDGG